MSMDPTRTRMSLELRHNSPLIGCRFDPTGRFVFTSAQDNTIQRFELANQRKTSLIGHRSWVRGLAFVAGKLLSADYNGKVHVWSVDAETPTPEQTIDAHRGWSRAIAVSPHVRLVATGGNDHFGLIWAATDFRLVRTLEGHDCHVYNVAFHPAGMHLLSTDLRGGTRVWNLDDGSQVRSMDCSVLFRYDPTFRADHGRSEERRVGKECRSRWWA